MIYEGSLQQNDINNLENITKNSNARRAEVLLWADSFKLITTLVLLQRLPKISQQFIVPIWTYLCNQQVPSHGKFCNSLCSP